MGTASESLNRTDVRAALKALGADVCETCEACTVVSPNLGRCGEWTVTNPPKLNHLRTGRIRDRTYYERDSSPLVDLTWGCDRWR